MKQHRKLPSGPDRRQRCLHRADFSEPPASPCVLCDNCESHRNYHERGPGQDQQCNPDQQDGYTDYRHDHTPDKFDVVEVPTAEQPFDRKPHEYFATRVRERPVMNRRPRSRRIRVSIGKSNAQTVKERNLPGLQFALGDFLGEEAHPIDLWKLTILP